MSGPNLRKMMMEAHEKERIKNRDYKYYDPKKFTTNPQEIYKGIDRIEKGKEFDSKMKDFIMGNNNKIKGIPVVKGSFTVGHTTENWRSSDEDKVKKEVRERTLNGKNIEMAINTVKNFTADEIDSKLLAIQMFNSSTDSVEIFTALKNKKIDPKIAGLEKFMEKYEILEAPHIDLRTGMSALVIGNRHNKEIEIIFGASQDPTGMFQRDTPKKMENFEGNKELEEYIEKGENGKYTRKDWGNNAAAPAMTPRNQKAAFDFVEYIKEKYGRGISIYKKLTTVNGHSKAGGEAIYSASCADLKCLTIDPAPVVNPGEYINNNKFLTIVPNMGNATLTATEKIEGTEFHVLKFKVGRNGKNGNMVSNTLALPVEYNREREEFIIKTYGKNAIAKSFVQHYPDNKKVVERYAELEYYTKVVEPKFNEVYKNGKYIDNRPNDNKINNNNSKEKIFTR